MSEHPLARYQPDGPNPTVKRQDAATLLLYRLNEVPLQYLRAAVLDAARNLREGLTALGVAR